MNPHCVNPAWGRVRRVLAVRLDNLGDVLMTTPALAAIRKSVPDVRLDVLASPAGAAVACLVPHIDRIIEFEAAWMKAARADDALDLGSGERRLVAQLAARRYDAAVIFTVCTQSALPAALLCRMAGIPCASLTAAKIRTACSATGYRRPTYSVTACATR